MLDSLHRGELELIQVELELEMARRETGTGADMCPSDRDDTEIALETLNMVLLCWEESAASSLTHCLRAGWSILEHKRNKERKGNKVAFT